MSVEFANRGIVRDGLIFSIDAFNRKSYISGSTEIYDLHKNGDTGTLTNGVTSDGFSLGFNGANQWVDFQDEMLAKFEFGDPFSVDFWIKKQTGSSFDWVVGRQGIVGGAYRGWGVLYNTSGELYATLNDTSPTDRLYHSTNTQYNNDTWNHHCFTFNGDIATSGCTWYTNGVEDICTSTLVGNPTTMVDVTVGSRMVIGRRYNEAANYMESDLRTLNIYNKELTHSEVKRNYFALKEKVYGT